MYETWEKNPSDLLKALLRAKKKKVTHNNQSSYEAKHRKKEKKTPVRAQKPSFLPSFWTKQERGVTAESGDFFFPAKKPIRVAGEGEKGL